MNSWGTLLLVDMARGRLLNLSPRDVTPWDYVALWGLVQAMAVDTVKT